jgi:SAM-dependent methyltransferase
MIEAFLLGLYILVISPILFSLGFNSPAFYFLLLFGLSIPGIYAMIIGAPFVPTKKEKFLKMIKLAKINKNSIVYDLGSGDGRFVFAAAKLNAKKSIGYELSLPIYILTKTRSFFYKNADIRYKNFWNDQKNYSDADVIFCFLLIKPMQKFKTEIWPNLKPGCLVISNIFSLPDTKPIFDKEGIRVYKKT